MKQKLHHEVQVRYIMAMRRRFFTSVLTIALFCLPAFAGTENQPQPKLPTTALMIADKKLITEVADDDSEREAGMMFRKSMADGTGMVFVFDEPQHVAFWMKNTLIPLSVAYLNPTGMILEVHDMQPQDETPVNSKFDSVAYAIEVPQGWFLKNGILPGAQVQGLPPLKRQ